MAAPMRRFKLVSVLAIPVAVLLSWTASAANVYRHVDKDGVVHYSDEPPTKDAKPVVLPPIQVVGPPRSASSSSSGGGAVTGPDLTGGAPLSVGIVSPTPDETFRGDDRKLPVAVRLDKPLPEGFGLLYLLDGRPQNLKATRALNFTLDGVERGEHMISVVTVDAAGREVARAAPIIVHMKPPTVQLTEQRKEDQKPKPKPAK